MRFSVSAMNRYDSPISVRMTITIMVISMAEPCSGSRCRILILVGIFAGSFMKPSAPARRVEGRIARHDAERVGYDRHVAAPDARHGGDLEEKAGLNRL